MTQIEIPELEFFSRQEIIDDFSCKHTRKLFFEPDFLIRLDELRRRCGFPFKITSGYRHPTHPIEARKGGRSGRHTFGDAADILITDGVRRYVFLKHAFDMGFNGIGAADTFCHIDDRPPSSRSPNFWKY